MVIHSYETERFCLAGLLRHPAIFGDVEPFINEYDFVSKLNRTIYSIIKSFLSKGDELNDFLIAEKVKNLNIRFDETDIETLDYIESLKVLQVTERSSIDFFKKLKQITVRREISEIAAKIQEKMKSANDAPIEEIVTMADQLYAGNTNLYEVNNDFVNIYESLEQKIEERGNNPIEEIGLMGPFPKVNELYGSLLRDGAVTVLGARTGVGKTSLGMFYLNHVAERYDIPILHLDQGEMSIEELQYRAVSMFTEGVVSYDALEHGYWRKNAEMTKLVRAVWPRVKKLKLHYQDVSNLTPEEILTVIRRYYYRFVGRGSKFLTHYDYLKAFDTADAFSKEWIVMGEFLKHIKNLFKNELHNSFWTSIQLNRTGITGNKTAAQIDDTENTFGISDRVTQQSNHSFLLRNKVEEELGAELNQFGNAKAICVKHRSLGRNAHDALNFVQTPHGLKKNFIHLLIQSFFMREMGDLASTIDRMGRPEAPNDGSAQLEDVDL